MINYYDGFIGFLHPQNSPPLVDCSARTSHFQKLRSTFAAATRFLSEVSPP
jgi:hypothetical protein